MRAKEYFRIFNEENQDKSSDIRLIMSLNQMIIEAKNIAKIRNAKSDESIIAIFKEMELKSISFINMLNEIEPYKSEGTIKKDALKLYMHSVTPEFAELVFGKIENIDINTTNGQQN
jgi:hypothetical protein